MTAKIQTEELSAIPPGARHSVTTHMPGWPLLLQFINRDPAMMGRIKSMYPRMMIHRDIKSLTAIILEKFGAEGQNCLLFSSAKSAAECKAFGTSLHRKDDVLKEEDVSILVFDLNVRLYAVFFPAPKTPIIQGYWMHTGMGISSRVGEEALKHLDSIREITDDSPAPEYVLAPAHSMIQERIAALLERAPAGPPRTVKAAPGDVYLYQTGMSAIYCVHQILQSHYKGTSVLFGFAFHNTIHLFTDFDCTGFKFLGKGTAEDLEALGNFLEAEFEEGRTVHAVYMEFPTNPIIVVPDLVKIRELANKYKFAIVVDDTIASFSNVDLFSAADIIVSSLTKSFSGYADVMAGSVVLNPSSPLYGELKPLFQKTYSNNFFNGDAHVLESNSRNYIERCVILNKNAERLVEYLQAEAKNSASSVTKVFYPTVSPTLSNYTPFMRAKTEDFMPGYGCLFSVEFESIETTIAFFSNLNVHAGPHLGAHLTLACPYVKALYVKELEDPAWSEEYDLRDTQIRISVGLEDTEHLLAVFKEAVEIADKVKAESASAEKVVVTSLHSLRVS